jgi:hypothetical protein
MTTFYYGNARPSPRVDNFGSLFCCVTSLYARSRAILPAQQISLQWDFLCRGHHEVFIFKEIGGLK